MSELAPIVLFVYNRPQHTRKTVEALANNPEAHDSILYVFSDAAKKEEDINAVKEVRDYIHALNYFKEVIIIERKKNYGLAKNIIEGVTTIVNKHGTIIVLEDDIVTSPAFLKFMNNALDYYENQAKVWHISGWNYPISSNALDDVFFWRVMNCWGWATWADRWEQFEKEPESLIDNWDKKKKIHFDLDGSGVFWNQVMANKKGKINTWAIFWYATIYQNNGLCLNPTVSYVRNVGLDGSGVHCGDVKQTNPVETSRNDDPTFSDNVAESQTAVESIKKYYQLHKKPFFLRVMNKVLRILPNKNLIK